MLDNYRPISILPAISKAFENILYDQLYGYLSNSGILSKYQFGFRRYHSTSAALLDSNKSVVFKYGQRVNKYCFVFRPKESI